MFLQMAEKVDWESFSVLLLLFPFDLFLFPAKPFRILVRLFPSPVLLFPYPLSRFAFRKGRLAVRVKLRIAGPRPIEARFGAQVNTPVRLRSPLHFVTGAGENSWILFGI